MWQLESKFCFLPCIKLVDIKGEGNLTIKFVALHPVAEEGTFLEACTFVDMRLKNIGIKTGAMWFVLERRIYILRGTSIVGP